VAYYVIGERQVRPGQMQEFVEATRRFGEHLARAGAPQEAFQLYVAEDDPQVALLVGRWPDPERMAAAHATVPTEIAHAARQPVLSGAGSWRWYAPLREVEAFGERTRILIAAQFHIDPTAVEPFLDWARGTQDAASRFPGVVATRLLAATNESHTYAYLGEYADDAAVKAVTALPSERPPPTPLEQFRRFQGQLGYWWDRPGQRELE
jgi:quinol monooxygenase YgiN